MPWNPEVYEQFKQIRYQPFFDLLHLLKEDGLQRCVDIGCGTGEQTAILAEKFRHASFLGIDSSVEMLAEAQEFSSDRINFELTTTEEFVDKDSGWDLIFSNAALQWSDHHHVLFPKLISKLNPGGQFAVQMPGQKENVLNKILFDMVKEEEYTDWLGGFVRTSPLLSIDEYAKILFENGLKDITIFIKVYPIIAKDETELYNFISGSALIPYMEKLDSEQKMLFSDEYKRRIREHFSVFPAMYAFKRILMYGLKG